MADRYWVGGTATWDTTNTAVWSDTAGGAGGFSVPTSADNVFFTVTTTSVTLTGALACADLTVQSTATGFKFLTGTTPTLAIYGSLSLQVAISWTSTAAITFASTTTGKTISTSGTSISAAITFDGVGGGWTLGGALTTTSNLTVTNGSFSTSASNFAVSCATFSSSNTNVRSITLNGSTVTVTASSVSAVNFSTSTNLTFTAGTSQITCSGATAGISVDVGLTFYNVSFTNTSSTSVTITGANTFRQMTFSGQITAGAPRVSFNANQTFTTGLTVSAGSGAPYRRTFISNTLGTSRTLTCAAVSLTDVNFRDITIAGAAAPAAGTRLGNCGRNSGITFAAGVNKYWNLAAGGNWSSTAWALTSGGATAISNFPLPQDTAIFEATGLNSGATVTINALNYDIGTIDMSARTANTMTFAVGTNLPSIYGNFVSGTGVTYSGTGQLGFFGASAQTLTSAGRTFTTSINIRVLSSSLTLLDSLSMSGAGSGLLTIGAGTTFDANGFNVTLTSGGIALTAGCTVAFGSGSSTWSVGVSGNSAFNCTGAITVTGTGTISMTNSAAKTFIGGGNLYSNITLNQGGTGALTVTGSNTFANMTNTAIGSVLFTAGTTNEFLTGFNLNGTSTAARLTLGSTTTAQASLKKTAAWYMGAGSLDNGNNTNLVFTAGGGIDFLAVSYINGISSGTTYSSAISETATGTETVSATQTFEVSLSDTATGTDAISTAAIFVTAVAETGTGTDSISSLVVFGSTLAETATGTDSVSSVASFVTNISETATGTDSVSTLAVFGSSIAETGSGTDSISTLAVLNSSLAETAAGADTVAVNLTLPSDISETATGADIIVGGILFFADISETGTGTDSIAALLPISCSIIETASGADAVSALATFVVSTSELATGTDSISTLVQLNSSVAESGSGTDVFAAAFVAAASIAETGTTSDTLATVLAAASTIAETAAGADVFAATSTLPATILETGAVSDSISAGLQYSASIAELATGTEIVVGGLSLSALILESGVGTDVIATTASINPAVLETVLISDAVSAAYIFTSVILESASITDLVTGARPWELVDDSQAANWATINNAQTTSWASVDDTQTPSWQNVNDSQTPGWGQIDDTQTPGWQDIQT